MLYPTTIVIFLFYIRINVWYNSNTKQLQTTFNVISSYENKYFWEVKFKIIAKKYISILVINIPLNGYTFSIINRKHSMLYFSNGDTVLIYTVPQEYISNNYVRIFGHLKQFSHLFLDWCYIRDQISASYFTLWGMFDTNGIK